MKRAFWIFLALYLVALLLFLIGTFGWFGQAPDPLAGVFLLPLGLPWNVIADRLGLVSALVGAGAPLINLLILFRLWQRGIAKPWA